MADRDLTSLLTQLQSLSQAQLSQAPQLLSRAKICLLQLNALVPSSQTSAAHLLLARDVLETGALLSIRLKDPESFTRYFQQLQPFYSLPADRLSGAGGGGGGSGGTTNTTRSTRSGAGPSPAPSQRAKGNQSKVTGLYLLLLLSQGDYAGFHTEIERLETAAEGGKQALEDDAFIAYPMRLEQALMEGSYDKVWGETKGERVPGEEFAVFTEVLISTIRSEIASCSERAYPSLPISNAKNLLFLESEGAVSDFAKSRGWIAKEGRIYFPPQDEAAAQTQDKDVLAASGQVIENALGYARKLETIV